MKCTFDEASEPEISLFKLQLWAARDVACRVFGVPTEKLTKNQVRYTLKKLNN